MGHEVTAVREDGPDYWTITFFADDDTARERGHAVSVPREAIANRMGAYGIKDPGEALRTVLHEVFWGLTQPEDPRDDPALIQGWVTTSDPDAEPVQLYTARSGADAAGAHAARMSACSAVMGLRDPGGLLPLHTPAPGLVQHHREMTDTYRWEQVYGALPTPSTPTPPAGPRTIPSRAR